MLFMNKKLIVLIVCLLLLSLLLIRVISISREMIKEINQIQIVDSDINALDSSIFVDNIYMRVVPEKRYDISNIYMPHMYRLDSSCHLFIDKIRIVKQFSLIRNFDFGAELVERETGKIYTYLPTNAFKKIETSFLKDQAIEKIQLNVASSNIQKKIYNDSLFLINFHHSNFGIKYNNHDEIIFEMLPKKSDNILVAFLKRSNYVFTIIISSNKSQAELTQMFLNSIRNK